MPEHRSPVGRSSRADCRCAASPTSWTHGPRSLVKLAPMCARHGVSRLPRARSPSRGREANGQSQAAQQSRSARPRLAIWLLITKFWDRIVRPLLVDTQAGGRLLSGSRAKVSVVDGIAQGHTTYSRVACRCHRDALVIERLTALFPVPRPVLWKDPHRGWPRRGR